LARGRSLLVDACRVGPCERLAERFAFRPLLPDSRAQVACCGAMYADALWPSWGLAPCCTSSPRSTHAPTLLAPRDDHRAEYVGSGNRAPHCLACVGNALGAHLVGARRARTYRATCGLRSPIPRAGATHRLPVLPRGRGSKRVGWLTFDAAVRLVPYAPLDVQRATLCRKTKQRHWSADPLEACDAVAGFRLLRSCDPRQQGRGL